MKVCSNITMRKRGYSFHSNITMNAHSNITMNKCNLGKKKHFIQYLYSNFTMNKFRLEKNNKQLHSNIPVMYISNIIIYNRKFRKQAHFHGSIPVDVQNNIAMKTPK